MGFAEGPLSLRQWGALRWLDVSNAAKRVNLVKRYAASLTSKSCVIRAAAAVRLGELGDEDALDALRELSETPKDQGPDGQLNCGQDEAAESVRKLKKRK